MQLERRDFRAMIYYDYMRALSASQGYNQLCEVFGDQSPSRATVFNWFAEFKRGRGSLSDEERPGRPATAVTAENLSKVKKLIRNDRHITYEEITEELQIGNNAVSTILHDFLGVRKVCARWIPHSLSEEQKEKRVDWCKFMLTKFKGGESKEVSKIVTGDESWIYQYDPETKQQSTVWLFRDESRPQKVKRSRSSGKQMVATFVSQSGHIATIPLQEQKTVTARWYIDICIPQVIENWLILHPRLKTSQLFWHHDNASSHKAIVTLDFFAENSIQVLPHPPYSPDLAPCDFFVFPKVKEQLRGVNFSSPEGATAAYNSIISEIDREAWKGAFKKWFWRMKLCIDANGEYFEKL